MTRSYVEPWTEQVPCPGCGRARTITADHRWYFTRAARRNCQSCNNRNRWKQHRQDFVDSLTRPFAKQYHPDETIIDWVVVDRLISGQRVTSTRAERAAAAAHLTALGLPASTIADRLHTTPRTVTRLRATIREQVAA